MYLIHTFERQLMRLSTPSSDEGSPELNLVPNAVKITPPTEYLAWLSRIREDPQKELNPDLIEHFSRSHALRTDVIDLDVPAGALVHPWWNPLNGPTSCWTEEDPLCKNVKSLPDAGAFVRPYITATVLHANSPYSAGYVSSC